MNNTKVSLSWAQYPWAEYHDEKINIISTPRAELSRKAFYYGDWNLENTESSIQTNAATNRFASELLKGMSKRQDEKDKHYSMGIGFAEAFTETVNDIYRDKYCRENTYVTPVPLNTVTAMETTNHGDEDMALTITKDFYRVNSKRMVAMIDEFVMDFIDGYSFSIQSEPYILSAIDIINDLMYELQDTKKIMNFKVVSDERNNVPVLGKRKDLVIEIMFRQTNCINQTLLRYTVHE